jgi:hypothetical protein
MLNTPFATESTACLSICTKHTLQAYIYGLMCEDHDTWSPATAISHTMTSLSVTSSVMTTPSLAKYEEECVVTIDEVELSEAEDGRTFHDTNAAYVLPNE